MLIQRSSPSRSSRIEMALASYSAVTASANRTPCLRRFVFALAGSHSASIACTIVHRLQGPGSDNRLSFFGWPYQGLFLNSRYSRQGNGKWAYR